MQIMFDPKVSAAEYHEQSKAYAFPDLSKVLCPQCKKEHLKKHGFYERYHISEDFTGHLLIRRHICKACDKTVSSIPSFCHPKRAHSIDFIIKLLVSFFNRSTTSADCLRSFLSDYKVSCSRQLLYQYRKRFLENLGFLAMELHRIKPLEGFLYDKEKRKRAKQVLWRIHHMDWTPPDVSLMLFCNSAHTYLTHLQIRV